MQTYSFELFADYFQFYLRDEFAEIDIEGWTKEAFDKLLISAPGLIAVFTSRNMTVPVTVEISDAPPEDDMDLYDQINECSIEIGSGNLVIMGCTDYFPEAVRIPVEPGIYRARIYYANLDSVSKDRLDGDDNYKVVLWPAPAGDTVILKQRGIKNSG